MTPAQQTMLRLLDGALPEGTVVTDPAAIAPWLTDWRGRWHGASAVLVQPDTTEAVVRIVRAAAEAGVPLVPQGGNSSMVGGATPPANGSAAILSLRRMDRVRSLDLAANLLVAEAGVILANLHAAAEAAGRRFPLTLGAKGDATVGGLVSTNAGGTQVLRWGNMRALVAGVEGVLPDGTVVDTLSALRKDNRGYDVTQLLVGAEGTLGVVTAATLRLALAVGARAVAWAAVASPADALALLRRFEAASDVVESFELLPRESLAAVLAYLPNARAPVAADAPWHVLVEAVSPEANGAPGELLVQVLGDAAAAGLVADAVLAASEAQAEAFWAIRHAISDAERRTGPATQHDVSVPVAAMPGFMTEASAACEARFPGTRASGFGHLGDGNVHFHVRAPAGADAAHFHAEEAPAIARFVHDLVVAAGGSISAEHGIGQMKLDELERLSPERAQLVRAIKRGVDPQGIMNPGKLVRLAPPEAHG